MFDLAAGGVVGGGVCEAWMDGEQVIIRWRLAPAQAFSTAHSESNPRMQGWNTIARDGGGRFTTGWMADKGNNNDSVLCCWGEIHNVGIVVGGSAWSWR